jgi:tetratricopeptide (TPR) repeat protein
MDIAALLRVLTRADARPVHYASAGWSLWMRSGDESVDTLMATGMRTMEAASTPAGGVAALEAALVAFTSAAALQPTYAEAWNKRATVLYLLKRFTHSLQDCERVVALNPDHFGALSGGAMCALSLGELAVAMRWFKAALAVNPRLDAAKKYVAMLSKATEQLDADGDETVEDMPIIRPQEEE